MIHVISIKKKQIYFFFISVLISAIITFAISLATKDKKDSIEDRCSKYISIKFENLYNSNVFFNYIQIVFNKELQNLIENSNLNLIENNIYFETKDCDRKILSTIENINEIEKIMKNRLNSLIRKLESNGTSIPVNDQVLLFDLEKNRLVNIEEKSYFLSANRYYTKMFIHFLTILIILNFLFYLKGRIKLDLK